MSTVSLPPEELNFRPVRYELRNRELQDLFVLCQILNQETPASSESLDAILNKGLHTASLGDLLIEACLARERPEAALDLLRARIATSSATPAAYTEAAKLLLKDALSEITLNDRLSSEARLIIDWCREAVRLEPRHPEANNLLALATAFSPDVAVDSSVTIENAVRALRGHAPTSKALLALAVVRWRLGDLNTARMLSQTLVDASLADTQSRKLAADLLVELNR